MHLRKSIKKYSERILLLKSKPRVEYFVVFFFLILLFLIYCFFPVFNYDSKYSQHVNTNPRESEAAGRIFLTDRNGEVITDKAYPNGYYKFIETDLESEFVQALVEIEDKNYFSHWGINIPAKIRALRDNLAGERVSGGSTITEQYVKNKYFKTHKRSYLQKAREWVLALYFDMTRSKEEILNIYYHDAYFGNQLYGVGAAIEVYFSKGSLDDLTEEEITILLSLLNNPSIENLEERYFRSYFEQVKERLGYTFENTHAWKLPKKENIDLFPFVTQNYLDDPVETQTTIDTELQSFTREVLRDTLDELKDKNVTNGAVFAMIPSTGEVLIYQWSKDFSARDIDGQVDVIWALRQPGSTVKPFLYLMALEAWANPDDLVLDIESEYNSFQEGRVYISENYSLKEYGLVRLKKALGNSFNNATVRLARELWLQEVYEYYESYGFSLPFGAEHYGYSLVLWNAETTLEWLVMSYRELLDLEDPEKFLLYDILSDPDNRDISFGVNSLLSTSIPQAVKTGTTSDFRDNLVVSYHPDLLLWVWVGNNDSSSMQGVTGITWAGYIWHQIVEKAVSLWYVTNQRLDTPEWIEQRSYCLDQDCFRKEIIYSREDTIYNSKIADKIFSESDVFEELSSYERERLDDLGITVK